MTFNLKKSAEEKYPIQVGGKMLNLSSEQISNVIKKKMRGDLAVQKLFEKFETKLDQLDNLRIEVCNLEGMYAETDLEVMKLDKSLFEDGQFFSQNYFVCVHEISHFLSRYKEDSAYFNDPEEVLGFVGSVASELARGTDIDSIITLIFPKIQFHFHHMHDAQEFMTHCIYKAKELLR